jgi:hypothetical protein
MRPVRDSDHLFLNAFANAFGQLVTQTSAQIPADALSAGEIQDNCQIDILMPQLDVCDIQYPDPIQSGYCCALQKEFGGLKLGYY